ncbi:MAG: M23 family metallopeptidase, partial [Desulfobulbaceae bacterium]|nr:M23 family metallopeptidase [Desulfobulbaceae bacterium]
MEVTLLQGNRQVVLFRKDYPGQGTVFATGPAQVKEEFVVDIPALGFAEGGATLEIVARDYSWWNFRRGNMALISLPVTIDTRPPLVTISSSPMDIQAGGAGLVIYQISEPAARHGVTLNGDFHPGYPLPGRGDNVYGATIAVRYDAEKIDQAFVAATDQAGNVGRAVFGMTLHPMAKKSDSINLDDAFLNQKIPEFADHYRDLKGTPLEQYLVINNRIRKENNDRIAEVCRAVTPERFWQGTFWRMARSSPKARYADHRTYLYQGEEIDEQVHLGIDLASTRHAEVGAANRGRVAFADYLGIYGNMVILDHGQGLFSLYSHLSQINCKVGDILDQGATLGLTGTSGMAGGDHLHFSILVNGIFVNPLEWWDPHWLKVNIDPYL